MSILTITTIQTQLHWENKAANLAMLEEKINSIKEKTELVVLPEMFSTGFSMKPELLAETMEGETVQWVKRMAAEKNIIITGSFICRDAGNDRSATSGLNAPSRENKIVQAPSSIPTHFYNRLIWMLPTGEYGYYDKRHCFGFAGEDEHYTPGTKRLIASVKGWKINLQVCYDLRFPVWARQHASGEPEYDVLIYVANWPERRIHAWKTLLQARAIENQCYVVGVNRVGNDGNAIYHSGDSMVVDPMGEVLYTKKDTEDIATITIEKEKLETIRSKFPFLKDADGFIIKV